MSPCADLHCGPHSYQECALLPELRGQLISLLSRREELNPQPSLYKSAALPLSYSGIRRGTMPFNHNGKTPLILTEFKKIKIAGLSRKPISLVRREGFEPP